MVINSRPLVYGSEDVLHESLTPYHLIYGQNIFQKTLQNTPKDLKSLPRRVKYLQTSMNSYWNRFTSCYLNELRQRHLYKKSKNFSEKLMVGDMP